MKKGASQMRLAPFCLLTKGYLVGAVAGFGSLKLTGMVKRTLTA